MDNNPLYSALTATLIVLSLFFIIIGNFWTIEGQSYSMSDPYEDYLADEYGNFEYDQAEFYASTSDIPPNSEGKITGKVIDTYGIGEINSQIWVYNYERDSYKVVGYDEIRTPVDTYVNSEDQTNPTYILNQDVTDFGDISVYINNSLVPSSQYYFDDVTTTLNETLGLTDSEIRVDKNTYFRIENEGEDIASFIIANERIDCEWKNGDTEFGNCKRGVEGTAASQHAEGSTVTQPGNRMLVMNIPIYGTQVVKVVHPIEYYYEGVMYPLIPTTISTVDYSEYNTSYSSYNLFTGEDSSTKTTTDNVHLAINISQLCFTLAMFLLFFIYFKVKIQFIDSEMFRTWAMILCALGIILAIGSGLYFFTTWINSYEEDTQLFETTGIDKTIWGDGRYDYSQDNFDAYTYQVCERERNVQNNQYGHLDNGQPSTNNNCEDKNVVFNQMKYIEYNWSLTINWFLVTLLIPILGLLCVYFTNELDVDGYYNSSTSVDSLDEFMVIPDHNDGYHVNFAEALGYGFSVLANWITYIVAIALINLTFFVIITWVLLQGTLSSLVITGVLGFIGFLLNAALFMAVLYKYQSDVGMKSSESIVTEGLNKGSSDTKKSSYSYGSSLPNVAIAKTVETETKPPKKKSKKKGKKGTKNNPEEPLTDKDFENIPVGKYYINPSDGVTYKKE